MDNEAVEAFRMLGIPRDSDHATIAHAYRRLARSVHPDVSADARAAERFASLAEAYRIACAAPPATDAAPTGTAVPVRRVAGPRPEPPIVAGPVLIVPPERREARHG